MTSSETKTTISSEKPNNTTNLELSHPGIAKSTSHRDDNTQDMKEVDDRGTSEEFDDQRGETERLQHLLATVKDQDELEKTIGRQADHMLLEQAEERDTKRLEKTLNQKDKIVLQLNRLQKRLHDHPIPTAAIRIRAEVQVLQPQLDSLNHDLEQIHSRMKERQEEAQRAAGDVEADTSGNMRQPGESRRDFLIRIGKITPFSTMGQPAQAVSSSLAETMIAAEDGESVHDNDSDIDADNETQQAQSHRHLLMPGFAADDVKYTESASEAIKNRPRKKRRTTQNGRSNEADALHAVDPTEEDDYIPGDGDATATPSAEETDSDSMTFMAEGPDGESVQSQKRKKTTKSRSKIGAQEVVEDLASLDDGNENLYQARLSKWVEGRRQAREKAQGSSKPIDEEPTDNNSESLQNEAGPLTQKKEWHLPHPTRPDSELQGGFRIPGDIWPSLFDYQKTGVQWLWELYTQQVGGIVGDEMGLGKTIQVISLLAGLHYSNELTKPIIIVTPATVMKQWVNEFHKWWPPLRVSILHSSGSGMMNVNQERLIEDDMDSRMSNGSKSGSKTSSKAAKRVVDRVLKEGHVLVTTYSGLQSYADLLIPVDWGYAVLDEGHKIRNPNTAITIYCKELRTSNRIILSGTPMQNNLTELWSLFDFIFPMRLGTLVNFRNQFEIPIKQGGYANASNLQVETALKCAETLKGAISPYLLQRFKVDVAADLPKKSEQVLFCRLTKTQRQAYEDFLASDEMKAIANGKRQVLYGIDILRKICNHPDLQDHRFLSKRPGYNYGAGSKSGKMQVVKELLKVWRDTGHKTLLFAQHRIMLDVLEKFIRGFGGFNYRRMDGNTQIKDRQNMVDEFNNDQNLHVFLLTTKVGGLGVNLTGADRVIIFDPDWNPSTDVQARERAWRLGQKREVNIYRLMSAGTIEEKIYHRQIFKQFLTNKILRDPKQRQTFQLSDLHDLFTLGNADDDGTETSNLFKGSEIQYGTEQPDTTVSTMPTSNEPNDSDAIPSIVGVSHREAFGPPEEKSASPESSNPSTPPNNNSDRLMSTLFSRSGVHSSLSHDAIINGTSSGSRLQPDAAMISREAKSIAASAARELQRNSDLARSVPIGTPTWTGLVGTAGRPEPPRISASRGGRGGRGSSSTAVLASLAARQNSNSVIVQSPDTQPRGKDFMILIRDYLIAQGGRCYTQMLVDHFNRFCSTAARTAEFKEMLREIAVLDRGDQTAQRGRTVGGRTSRMNGRGGRATWVLKKQFGGTAE